jgi:hypothetical protein
MPTNVINRDHSFFALNRTFTAAQTFAVELVHHMISYPDTLKTAA